MKKFLYKLAAFSMVLGVLTGCEEDRVNYDVDGGRTLAGFQEEGTRIYVKEDPGYTVYEVEVGVTTRSSVDRVITFEVNEELTNATEDMYQFESTSFVIPAGEFIGKIRVRGNYLPLPEVGEHYLVLDLIDIQGADVISPVKSRFAITFSRDCPKEIAESYTGYVTSHSVPPFEVDFVNAGYNAYYLSTAWGDFVAALTGDDGYAGRYQYPGNLFISCDNVVVFTGTQSGMSGGSGFYDPNSGIISLTLAQSLFTTSFTATVQFVPNE